MPNSGIYKIINILNNKLYIGSAINLQKRKKDHFCKLKHQKHCNGHLQKSYNKYGVDNFKFEIIITCDKENLLKEEQYYIDILTPQYNICKTAGSKLGWKAPKETCEKIRISNTGKKQTELHKYHQSINRKTYKGKVYQFTLDMKLIKIWDDTIVNIAKSMNIKRKRISECLNKRNNSSFGYKWIYEKEVTIAK